MTKTIGDFFWPLSSPPSKVERQGRWKLAWFCGPAWRCCSSVLSNTKYHRERNNFLHLFFANAFRPLFAGEIMRLDYSVILGITGGTMKENRTKKTSFSIEPDLLEQAKVVARLTGYRFSFSAYLSDVLRRDIECRLKRQASA